MKDYQHLEILRLAHKISLQSSEVTKVGSIILSNSGDIIATGFNHCPEAITITAARSQRDIKLKLILHAEEHAILSAKRDLKDASIFITIPPCAKCATFIIASGIKNVICANPNADIVSRWADELNLAQEILIEAKVNIFTYALDSVSSAVK